MDKITILLLIVLTLFALTGCQEYNLSNNGIIIHENNNEIETTVAPTAIEEVPAVSGDLKVYFLDVGQADCIFVQNNDATMLIDAGNNPDGKYVSKYLRKELGIKRIDYLIGTHPHEDHIGGLDIIIQDFEIGNLFMPDRATENKSYTDVIKYANEAGLKAVSPQIGTKFNVGSAICEIMTKNDNAEEINDTSIVVELTYGNKKFLFTADMLETEENLRTWNDIDVLKVSHHGSTYSSKNNFLNQVKPEIAIIMCGKNNDYHYPHEAVLDRLEQNGCNEIYITSKEGTILLTCDGNDINVECLKQLDFDGNK